MNLPRSKYGSRKTVVDGITFDSKAEARRYGELKLMERAGAISDLELQPSFEILPAFRDASGARYRAIKYLADFRYIENGKAIVEDVKGMETPEFKLKRKMLLSRYPETILRITK